jgi:hypothetical protein
MTCMDADSLLNVASDEYCLNFKNIYSDVEIGDLCCYPYESNNTAFFNATSLPCSICGSGRYMSSSENRLANGQTCGEADTQFQQASTIEECIAYLDQLDEDAPALCGCPLV